MYVAWTVGYVGVALVAAAAWPLLLLPVVLVVTHAMVLREERSLERRFGDAYRGYKTSVRRYLWIVPPTICRRGAGPPEAVRRTGMIIEASKAIGRGAIHTL